MIRRLVHTGCRQLPAFNDFVMGNGGADHEVSPHCAVQLRSMLRLEGSKGNQNQPVGGTRNEKRT